MSDPLPVLRCESRRQPAFERGFLLWSLAAALFGAAALDAFWVEPAPVMLVRATPLEVQLSRCREARAPTPVKVEDVKLLTPTQAAR